MGGLSAASHRRLHWIKERYGDIPLYITENGSAFPDPPTAIDGRVEDPLRVDYLRDHLHAVHDAMQQGVDLRGYYRVVSPRQLRVESRIREAFRNRARELRDAGANDQVQRPVLLRRSSDPTGHRSAEIMLRLGSVSVVRQLTATLVVATPLDGLNDDRSPCGMRSPVFDPDFDSRGRLSASNSSRGRSASRDS